MNWSASADARRLLPERRVGKQAEPFTSAFPTGGPLRMVSSMRRRSRRKAGCGILMARTRWLPTLRQSNPPQLSGPALDRFQRAVDDFAEALMREAERLEADERATGGEPEFTSTIIEEANRVVRKRYRTRRRSRVAVAGQLGSYASVAAITYEATRADTGWFPYVFIATVFLGFISLAAAYVREWHDA